MAGQAVGLVRTTAAGLVVGAEAQHTIDPSGASVVMDFYTKALLEERAFQVRMGALTTPVSADVEVTTVAAEAWVNSTAAHVLIPTHFTFNLEALVGTLPQASVKTTASAGTGGTPFVPLPMFVGGRASWLIAATGAAGGVAVVDDALTTTRLLYASTQAVVGNFDVNVDLTGRGAVKGLGNVYVAIGSVTTGSTYFMELSYLEYTKGELGL